MIIDDELMRLLKRADPARYGHVESVIDGAGYLDRLRTRSATVTLVDIEPASTRRPGGHRRLVVTTAEAAAVLAIVAGVLVLALRDGRDGAPAVEPAELPGNGLIAFVGDVSGFLQRADFRSEVYVVEPDGTGLRRLTSTPDVGELYPTWSPDGTRLAFVRDLRPGDARGDGSMATLVVVDPATGEETLDVTLQVPWGNLLMRGPGQLVWSPDGRSIGIGGGNMAMQFIDSDTGRRHHSAGDVDYELTWSPDGRWAVGGTAPGYPQIALFSADPWLRVGDVLLGPFETDSASWRPDSTAVAVTVSGRVDVLAVPDGERSTLIDEARAPAFSPAGDRIAFLRSGDLWIAASDGSDQREVATDVSVFAWAPDGSRIAYRPAQRDELWAMTADGSDAHLVDASISDPSWSPDGTLLLGQGSDGLFTIRPDGTDRTVLTPGLTLEEPRPAQVDAIDHYRPAWQPLIDDAG